MNHFEDRPGPSGAPELWCEGVSLSEIARAVGTPVYVYSTATLERHFQVFRSALTTALPDRRILIAYAVKANPNLAVIRTLADLGAGADTVSEGEIRRALAAGVPTCATMTPVNRELLDGAAWLVDESDPTELVGVIESLFEDDARRAVMAAAGRSRAADFSPAAAARSYAELYESVLRRRLWS